MHRQGAHCYRARVATASLRADVARVKLTRAPYGGVCICLRDGEADAPAPGGVLQHVHTVIVLEDALAPLHHAPVNPACRKQLAGHECPVNLMPTRNMYCRYFRNVRYFRQPDTRLSRHSVEISIA
jgi:hypothetical protein